jgi:hypothetical protein
MDWLGSAIWSGSEYFYELNVPVDFIDCYLQKKRGMQN